MSASSTLASQNRTQSHLLRAWRAKGIKNRMEFFRGAIGHYLAHLGARDAAALLEGEGSAHK